jgi:DNA-binding PadR family transcriptional regulator
MTNKPTPAHLGDLEQLVLLALLRLGDDGYGVVIAEEIERRAGREVSLGSVYKTLTRLDAKGLVGTRLGEPTAERGGRRKRYYHLLPLGRRALGASLDAIRRLAVGVEGLIPGQ